MYELVIFEFIFIKYTQYGKSYYSIPILSMLFYKFCQYSQRRKVIKFHIVEIVISTAIFKILLNK